MISDRRIAQAVQELQDITGLAPGIDTRGMTREELITCLRKIAGLLEPDDMISPRTLATLCHYYLWPPHTVLFYHNEN